MQKAAFLAGVMLILNVWRSRNAGIRLVDEEREMKAVETCIEVLKKQETRSVFRHPPTLTLSLPKFQTIGGIQPDAFGSCQLPFQLRYLLK